MKFEKDTILITELSDIGETFNLGQRTAQVKNVPVVVVRRSGNRTIPIMEFEKGTGRFTEVLAHPLRVNLMARMLQKIEDLPPSRQATKIVSQYAGVEALLPEKETPK